MAPVGGAARRDAVDGCGVQERERDEREQAREGEGSACRFIEGEGKGRGRRGGRWWAASSTIDGAN
jgi:hypothetical protein